MDREQFNDPRWCEAQYNNRLLVANAADFVERWPRWAAATRTKLQHEADISYGPHARETIDFFHAENPRGLLAFIHGGYWRAFSKHEFSWIAEGLVGAGYSVALINYPLCPEVSVLDIARCSERAIVKIWDEARPSERAAFVVSGHSAGGYLTATCLRLIGRLWACRRRRLRAGCQFLAYSNFSRWCTRR